MHDSDVISAYVGLRESRPGQLVKFSPAGKNWSTVVTRRNDLAPSPRSHAAAVVDETRHRMLVVGGRLIRDKSVYALDFDTMTWSRLKIAATGRSRKVSGNAAPPTRLHIHSTYIYIYILYFYIYKMVWGVTQDTDVHLVTLSSSSHS